MLKRFEEQNTHSMAKSANREQILKDAWIGDAVLCLYARLKILREDGAPDGPKQERMTSNQFLSGWAEPSETEAEIGRIYAQEGLEPAFQWIEARLMPMFARQEAKRMKGTPSSRAKKTGPARHAK